MSNPPSDTTGCPRCGGAYIDQKPSVTEHAKDRIYERYGWRLTVAEWDRVLETIQTKTAMLVGRNIDGSEVWSVSVEGPEPIRVVYWPAPRNQIVTVVPPGKLNTSDRRLKQARARAAKSRND